MTPVLRLSWFTLALAAVALFVAPQAQASDGFRSVAVQYIAALADPAATSGTGAETWGLWREDPGPRGVRLAKFEALLAAGGKAPSQWTFDANDWWMEENGLIMERPDVGVPSGRYLVTGNRATQAVLTIHPKDANGKQDWDLSDGATIYDVTHLRCRSARYTPQAVGQSCSPSAASQSNFPVTPGAAMPPVPGCSKQDHAVVFIIGVAG